MNDPIRLLEKDREEARAKILLEAASAVLQDRNADYGAPEDNFKDIIDMWNIYRRGMKTEPDAKDAAIFQIIVKLCRLKQSPCKADHWVDIAGYSACGYRAAISGGLGSGNLDIPLVPLVNTTKPTHRCGSCLEYFTNEDAANLHETAKLHRCYKIMP